MLTSFHLHKKSSEVSIKTRSTPALLSIQGQDTKHTTVKWPIVEVSKSFAAKMLKYCTREIQFIPVAIETQRKYP